MTISTRHKYNRGKISKVIEKVYVVYNGEWLCIVVEQKNQNRKKERKALLKESAKNRLVLLFYCVLSGFIHLTFHCPEQYARARMCVCVCSSILLVTRYYITIRFQILMSSQCPKSIFYKIKQALGEARVKKTILLQRGKLTCNSSQIKSSL